MQLYALVIFFIYLALPSGFAEDVSYQACVDKYSRKGYQPWQEWSDHYTCHRYRCEIRDGKYFIAAVGCRKPKIPENALECHEYIEDENVEFPTCCARLRCVVEINGERIVQTRGQPGELFPDKPWKGQQNEPNPAVVGMGSMPQNTVGGESQGQAAPAIFNNRGAADGDISGRRYLDPYPAQQLQESPRKKRSTGTSLESTGRKSFNLFTTTRQKRSPIFSDFENIALKKVENRRMNRPLYPDAFSLIPEKTSSVYFDTPSVFDGIKKQENNM